MLAYFLIAFGALCAYAGIRQFSEVRRVRGNGVKTVARVVEIREVLMHKGDSGRRQGYSPIYAYEDDRGKEHRMPPQTKSSVNRFRLGAEKEVIYDPDDPTKVVEAGIKPYFAVAAFAFIAVISVALGVRGVLIT